MREPVVAYHLIITAYGFWLPNDPRGSWSDFVRSWELFQFGPATKTTERRSLARDAHDRARRLAAKEALTYQPVHFDGVQARAIARGIADYCDRTDCRIHACSIMPSHLHAVVGRRANCSIEQTARLLKQAATAQLICDALHPFAHVRYADRAHPSPWTRKAWSVYLGDGDVDRAIDYVERNPIKEGKRAQRWNFVRSWEHA
jgi:REP element-mobilizing transposase RayT